MPDSSRAFLAQVSRPERPVLDGLALYFKIFEDLRQGQTHEVLCVRCDDRGVYADQCGASASADDGEANSATVEGEVFK